MAGTIKISTDQVSAIANEIEMLNNKLNDTLTQSKEEIMSLKTVWQGEAADATVNAYNAFANNFFSNYYEVIKSYVKFLRENVVLDYEQTETVNTSLGDSFR